MPKRFQNHFHNFVEKFSLIDKSEDLVVSFSGGVDSVVLVDLLINCGYFNKLLLIHYNHLNRKGNAKDETFVRDFCQKRNLNFKIIQLPGLTKSNFENSAREMRYESLKSIAKDNSIVFGHHIDDSFEWSLMQQFKSSTLKSSIGIPLVNGNIIRPLMCLTKKQITYYARLRDLDFSQDPTNFESEHERNYIRNTVIPLIATKYPSYLKNYVSRSQKLAVKFDLGVLRQRKFKVAEQDSFSEIYSFDHSGDFDLLDELIDEQIKRLSSKKRGSTRSQIQKIKQALRNNSLGPLILVDGIKVFISYNHLYISKVSPQSSSSNSYSRLTLHEFRQILVDKNTFFSSFVFVSNYRFNTMKRSYPFTSESIGRIPAIDLMRQWSKEQNKNKKLDLVF